MDRCFIWMTFLMITSACSSEKQYRGGADKWEIYKDPASLKGLQIKPVDVVYNTKGIHVNGRLLDESAAIDLLIQSRKLNPVPGILVEIDKNSYKFATPFLLKISRLGLCDEAKCRYKIVE